MGGESRPHDCVLHTDAHDSEAKVVDHPLESFREARDLARDKEVDVVEVHSDHRAAGLLDDLSHDRGRHEHGCLVTLRSEAGPSCLGLLAQFSEGAHERCA